jgi:serine-type D-Ala-D-Ala carboxypeptidase/endopeptidase (penicillin-binding protein 4)
MKFFFLAPMLFSSFISFSQQVNTSLQIAVKKFETDHQMKHAGYSLYVVDAVSGKTVFEKNSQLGMATASCLKLVTSATAFEKLGKDFRYKTNIGYNGNIINGVLEGDLFITGSGDPTLGSWRWTDTKMENALNRIVSILKEKKIATIKGKIFLDDCGSQFHDIVPGSWTWDDLGNYYGAPARVFNWHENQYDVTYKTGAVRGTKAAIVKLEPPLPGVTLANYVRAGAKGSGDRTIIYLPPYSTNGFITGTVPVGENAFSASGAIPEPSLVFISQLQQLLKESDIVLTDSIHSLLHYYAEKNIDLERNPFPLTQGTILGQIISPPFDSMNFWFMRRSINLYGEAFLRTVTSDSGKSASSALYKEALDSIKKFWKAYGIDESALNMYDGSGLSPQNRVTTDALVKVLRYAKTRPWFASYYNAFPEYNGMKLKSGTIGDVKGFAGYHKSKNGKEYVIAFLVNNYDGTSSSIVGKMYKVLDELK